MKSVIKVELIDEYLKEHKMSLTKFCKISKITPSTIKRMRENRNINVTSIFKLAIALNLKAYEVVNSVHDKLVK